MEPNKYEDSYAGRLAWAMQFMGYGGQGGMTVLANKVGVKVQTLSQALSGKTRELSASTHLRVAEKLGINAKWLAFGEGPVSLQHVFEVDGKEYSIDQDQVMNQFLTKEEQRVISNLRSAPKGVQDGVAMLLDAVVAAPDASRTWRLQMGTYAERLKDAMAQAGFGGLGGQSKLAHEIGTIPQTINKVLNGSSKELSALLHVRICLALGINPLWLSEGKGNRVALRAEPLADGSGDDERLLVAIRRRSPAVQAAMTALLLAVDGEGR